MLRNIFISKLDRADFEQEFIQLPPLGVLELT